MLGFGLGVAATVAHNAGHEVRVIDNNSVYRHYTDKDLLKIIRSYQPDVVAFNLTILNAFQSYKFLDKLKMDYPDILTLAGGIHMRHSFQEGLEKGIDMIVHRESELVIPALLAHLEGKNKSNFFAGLELVKGVSFCYPDGAFHITNEHPMVENLDDVPFVNYDLFNLQDYFKNKQEPGAISICGQRGCPFNCTFCADDMQKADSRVASGEYMFRYVQYLYEKYGQRYIVISDNNFTHPRKRVQDFFDRIVHSSLSGKVAFTIQTKVETPLDDDLLALMKRGGVISVALGLERMDLRSQQLIDKVTPYDKVISRLELLKRHNVRPMLFVLLGFPFETKELLQKERDAFMALTKYTKHIHASVLQPTPGIMYYHDYPKTYQWYLDESLYILWRSYFTAVFATYMVVLVDKNFFDLPEDVRESIKDTYMEFKDLDHAYYINNKNLISAFILKMDKLVARSSKFFYAISPDLEFAIFRRIKAVRYYLGTLIYSKSATDIQ